MSYSLFDYSIKIFFDKRDSEYCAYLEEVPEVSAYGTTVEKAIKELQTVYKEWLKICRENKYPVPKPLNLNDYSGKFVVRIPKSLHKRLTELAKKENVSLNQELLYCITRGILAV